jgi:cytoskeletal protein CcmA (bactofilin family)
MAFRRDSKIDAFQRQISALRNQLGGEQDDFDLSPSDMSDMLDRRSQRAESHYDSLLPRLDPISLEPSMASLTQGDRGALPVDNSLPPLPAVDMETSVIAHSTKWTGDLSSNGSLHVYGHVQGALTARDTIFVAAEADVEATIAAETVTIAGTVRGSIQCTGRFEILPHGRVIGDVRAPSLVIHEGALMSGQMSMGQVPESRSSQIAAGGRGARGGD